MEFIEICIDILISIKSKWKLKIPMIRFLYIMLIASLFFMFTAFGADTKRGVRIQDTEGKEVGFYQESYALVVGASAYRKGWSKLPGVVDDIKAVSKALKMHGFAVTVIRDPDHEKLKSAFNDFINSYGYDPNNRLLFYFAGHGHTIHKSYGADMGYIVPVDAPHPEVDRSEFLAKALDMQQFEVYARRIESKHALFLFDSCFSGSIFALERAIPKHISYKTARPVRQFITSGSADETVPDKSIFRHQFLEALDGEADVNEDGYITSSELGEFLFEKVVNYSRGTQHPQYGKIRDMYLDKGDFVFVLKRSDLLEIERKMIIENLNQENKTPKLASIPKEMQKAKVSLRKEPQRLSEKNIATLLLKYHFFDSVRNASGNFKNDIIDNPDGTITDRATGLVWQKGGSTRSLPRRQATSFVKKLNKEKFAGFSDWRLPTIEELASLLMSTKNRGLYINPIFDKRQKQCWSADLQTSAGVDSLFQEDWIIKFDIGYITYAKWVPSGPIGWRIRYIKNDWNYVRAVRSLE